MAKKNKNAGFTLSLVKYAMTTVVVVFLLFISARGAIVFLRSLEYFTVRNVVAVPPLPFIKSNPWTNLVGENIFDVNLRAVQERMQRQYPQIARLKILKKFPDEIVILAQERLAFAQARVAGIHLVVDQEGIILSIVKERAKELPLIVGINSPKRHLEPGFSLHGDKKMEIALLILKAFNANKNLSVYPISDINVENLSQITLSMTDGLKIIFDQEALDQKIPVLSLLLSQGQLSLSEIKYIDLRFKEPIIGKKTEG